MSVSDQRIASLPVARVQAEVFTVHCPNCGNYIPGPGGDLRANPYYVPINRDSSGCEQAQWRDYKTQGWPVNSPVINGGGWMEDELPEPGIALTCPHCSQTCTTDGTAST